MRLTRKPSLHPATLWQALPGHYSPHLQTAEQFHPQGHHRTKQSHNPHTLHHGRRQGGARGCYSSPWISHSTPKKIMVYLLLLFNLIYCVIIIFHSQKKII